MAKMIDITEKLDFESKPLLIIKDTTLEVNSDAVTLLKVLQKLGDEPNMQDIGEACDLIFTQENQEKLQKLNLNIKDYMTVIKSALELAMGNTESVGE